MAISLTRTFQKFKDAYAVRAGKPMLLEAAKARDGADILSLLRKTPSLIDAPLEFVPGQADRLTIFDFLLQSGAPQQTVAAVIAAFPKLLTQADENGDTLPLRYFRESESGNALQSLMGVIPDKSVANGDGDTLLHIAARRGSRYATVAAHMNPFIEARNKKGQTPLMLAAAKGGAEAVATLLRNKADIHATDNDGLNAVMHAIRHSELYSATLLMKQGARVNFSDPAVETQMLVATMEVNLGFLETLKGLRKAQEEEDKASLERQKQEAFRARKENLKGINQVAKQGTGRIRAPKTASFTQK